MKNFENVGLDWLLNQIDDLTETIDYIGPVDFIESTRILPPSVTNNPGPMSYDLIPFMIEIVECFSMRSPVRDVALMKGVQMSYTVGAIESILMYYMAYLKIYPMMLASADKELVKQRIENNILPMLQHSGFEDIIQSSDAGNSRKTGQTDNLMQFKGGAFMVPIGAQNANKMRSHSILLLLQDEIDAWPLQVGRDGDPDKLTRARTNSFDNRKILCGSTPLEMHTSKIYKNYLKGDQRHYFVKCKHCGFSQFLEWKGENKEGKTYGIAFDHDNGMLIPESVRYLCKSCLGEHYEYDKYDLFKPENGAEWRPTATGIDPFTRSYYMPAYYSPFFTWADCVSEFFECYDVVNNKVVDIAKYQTFVNNVKGMPFEQLGDRVRFQHVSSHRRSSYHLGEVPSKYALEWSGSEILFIVCTVDVHGKELYVKTTGICRDCKTYLIDYFTIHGKNCEDINDVVWSELQKFIEEKVYVSDTGREYVIYATFIDTGFASDTVKTFTENYMTSFVFPIFGRENPGKNSKYKEFAEFRTQSGKVGYNIKVDYYKNRISSALRRLWIQERGEQQSRYHFNAPVDISDKKLQELTVESKRKKTDGRGNVSYEWHRPSGSANELWDLTVYAHAGVDIIAYLICRVHYQMDAIDWPKFWDFAEQHIMPEVTSQ